MDVVLLRLDGPMQAWGGVANGAQRTTRAFPSLSGLTGLVGNALGLGREDGEMLNRLQDGFTWAVAEVRAGTPLVDFQTAHLQEQARITRFGLERRLGSARTRDMGWRHYIAGGAFLAALGVVESAPFTAVKIGEALKHPARPLFLGRKNCPPAAPVFAGVTGAASAEEGLLRGLESLGQSAIRRWREVRVVETARTHEVWDRRDYAGDGFTGSRYIEEVHDGEVT